MQPNATSVSFYTNIAGAGWTASGSKYVQGTLIYQSQ